MGKTIVKVYITHNLIHVYVIRPQIHPLVFNQSHDNYTKAKNLFPIQARFGHHREALRNFAIFPNELINTFLGL